MKRLFDIVCTLIECLLFLWLVIGLWACATKIREHEKWHEEHAGLYNYAESPENKLLLVAMRCQKMEQDIPDAGLVIFEGGDHFAYLRQWLRFVTVVRAFLT